ncbi:hypothetical protein [Streptomyces ziwulingensis]|uniref:Uncharacterized protein n=1 Tax=Streptomyces ziwulingensis TaxID=1045501 RepID=A0ABP9CYJ5_9ACTN
MTTCDHCHQPIEGDVEEVPVDSPTGAAPNPKLHPSWCPPAPHRSTPATPPHLLP